MIITSETAPSRLLTPFVHCYTYREFDTKGSDFIKPLHAEHKISMPFFFKALPVKLVDPKTGEILKTGKASGVTGLCTQYNGEMTFNGSYSFFEIVFKPNGFHKVFNIPANEIVDQLIWGEEIFNSDHQFLLEQLFYAHNLTEMASLADAYLLHNLKKQKIFDFKDRMSTTVDSIIKNRRLVNVDQLAYHANMSRRSFERHFNATIGVSPKLLCSITRFNHALKLKLKNQDVEWTSIAHQSGYFDQTHLIKDFKRFTGNVPSILLKETPLLNERYISRVDV